MSGDPDARQAVLSQPLPTVRLGLHDKSKLLWHTKSIFGMTIYPQSSSRSPGITHPQPYPTPLSGNASIGCLVGYSYHRYTSRSTQRQYHHHESVFLQARLTNNHSRTSTVCRHWHHMSQIESLDPCSRTSSYRMRPEKRKDSGRHPMIADLQESLPAWGPRALAYRSLMTVVDSSSWVDS